MPGSGLRTGARILAETGDGSAVANGSRLAAYVGLAPVTRQCGTSPAAETRSRRGNDRLNNSMFPAPPACSVGLERRPGRMRVVRLAAQAGSRRTRARRAAMMSAVPACWGSSWCRG